MSQTRVEKFKKYRDEINRLDDSEASSRTLVSQKVDSYFGPDEYDRLKKLDKSTLSISYEEIMDAASVYEKETKNSKGYTLEIPPNKKKIAFYVISSLLLSLLASAIIFLALKMWVL